MRIRLLRSFLTKLALASDNELAKQVQYLRTENQILRAKLPKRIEISAKEKRQLIRFGKPLGSALKNLIGIVSMRTFYRWLQTENEIHDKKSTTTKRKPGRPRIDEEIRLLVIRLATDNFWGASRIHGELLKLGVEKISRSTVASIMREAGIEPDPERRESTWAEFVSRHAKTLWACDFFTKTGFSIFGPVTYYILLFIHIETRKIHIAGMTPNPDDTWMRQQARNMKLVFDEEPEAPRFLILDNDTKFTEGFCRIFEDEEIEIKRTAICAPNQNAYAERAIQTIKHECLDHFIVFGEHHLRYLLTEFLDFYHRQRPHQGKGNRPLPVANGEKLKLIPRGGTEIICHERLGGHLKHYERQAV